MNLTNGFDQLISRNRYEPKILEIEQIEPDFYELIEAREPTATFVTLKEEYVDHLLSLNTHNRKIRDSQINYLANQIKKGLWCLTSQGLAVSNQQVLLDGQHRLLAIAKCGYPELQTLLVTGLEPIAQTKVDVNSRRSINDILLLKTGDKSITARAFAGIRMAVALGWPLEKKVNYTELWQGLIHKKAYVTTEEIEEALNQIRPAIALFYSSYSKHIQSKTAVLSAFIHLYLKDRDAFERMVPRLVQGINLQPGDGFFFLRDRLINREGSLTNGSYKETKQIYAQTVAAIHSEYYGTKLKQLRTKNYWDF